VWVQLMNLVSFVVPDTTTSVETLAQLLTDHAALSAIYSSAKASDCFDSRLLKSTKGKLCLDDICKLFILVNIEGLMSKNVIDMYTTQLQIRNFTPSILASLADNRLTQASYVSTFKCVFAMMQVDVVKMNTCIVEYNKAAAELKSMGSLRQDVHTRSRISLRHILKTINNDSSSLEATHSGIRGNREGEGGLTTFDMYHALIRFPNSMSKVLKLRCFLLGCMGHLLDIKEYSHVLVSGTVQEAVNKHPVQYPDPVSICNSIQTLVMKRVPFPELVAFRHKCHSALAHNHWKSLSLSQYLHLYISAYIGKESWKSCWKYFFQIMSPQISKVSCFIQIICK